MCYLSYLDHKDLVNKSLHYVVLVNMSLTTSKVKYCSVSERLYLYNIVDNCECVGYIVTHYFASFFFNFCFICYYFALLQCEMKIIIIITIH